MQRFEFVKKGELRYVDAPMPVLESDDDAIVQPVVSTTCDLDRFMITGQAPFEGPFALGHETVAKVIEVGDNVSHVTPGQLVVPAWHVACGTCASCVSGRPTGCTNVPRYAMFGLPAGGDYGGFFSEAVRIPFAGYALAPLPEGVSARAAASVGDNLSDTYGAVARALRNAPGADVLVIGGTGSVGVFAVTFAKALGASSVAYVDSFDPECVELARRLGAEILDEAPPGREFQVTFDASGRPDGLHAALGAVARGGTCHSFGIYWRDVAVPAYAMYMQGVTFTTGRPDVGPDIPDVLALIADGTVDPLPVFSDVVSFDDAPTALAQGLRKPLVVRDGY
ncbi:zinc-binding dehydrogenase [Streptomyces sp. NPDC059627]